MTLMTSDADPSPPLPGRLPRERPAEVADAAALGPGDFPGVRFRSFFPPLSNFLRTPPFFFVADFTAENVTCGCWPPTSFAVCPGERMSTVCSAGPDWSAADGAESDLAPVLG